MIAQSVATDIDIDFADRTQALAGLMHVPAAIVGEATRARHPSGVYFQDIPTDPLDLLAVFDHRDAAQHGYFKIDFLNASLYRPVRDEAHLDRLLATAPDWSLLEHAEVVAELAHIGNHFAAVRAIRPRSVDDLAVCLALVRPGKRYLIGQPRAVIDAEIWQAADGYAYKRSHALAYALSIVVQLNLLCEAAAANRDGAASPADGRQQSPQA